MIQGFTNVEMDFILFDINREGTRKPSNWINLSAVW